MLTASITEALSTSALTVAVLTALAYFARTWAVAEIQEAVKADYQAGLEQLKEELRRESVRRERAAAIADFLATWVADNFDPEKRNNAALLDIQRKYWELALWLDAPTLRELNRALSHEGDHVLALVRVRESIVGKEQEPIGAAELIRWVPVSDWSNESFPRRWTSGQVQQESSGAANSTAPPAPDVSEPPAR